MTPDPTTVVQGVPWGTIVTVAGSAVVVISGILVAVIRMWYGAQQKGIEEKFAERDKDVLQLESRLKDYFKANERLRDKWEIFLTDYLKIDSTRGQKVDALFRIVDQMQETVKELRPALNEKVEEMLTHSLSELKLYVRDRIREERKDAE